MPTDIDLPALYDLDAGAFDEDLPLYDRLARERGGSVLELGVGTGRAAIPLARLGLDVRGIDSDAAMIERARANAGGTPIQLSCGDMRRFELGEEFGLIFAGYGAFQHLLTRDDQLACLRSVGKHLAPGGAFVCDASAHHVIDWEPDDSVPLYHEWTRVLPAGERVIKLRSVRPDPETQVQHELHCYDVVAADGSVRRLLREIDLRFTTDDEMLSLLREAGLEPEGVYGDYEQGTYTSASDYMITIARPADESSR